MAFTKINSSGWAVGDELTSAQMNQLDSDHANSLDKSVAGDSLSGIVTMNNGSLIRISNPGAAIVGSVANAIQITAVFGMNIATAQGLLTSVAGGFVLGGGSSDYPVFNPARAIVRGRPIQPHMQLNSPWAPQGTSAALDWGASGGATAQNQSFRLDELIDGATLTSIAISFYVPGTHVGGLPANLPTFTVQAGPLSGPFSPLTLNSGDSGSGLSPSPASGSAWHNANAIQTFTYPCNQNNVINTEQFIYLLQIVDENGVNSQSGNTFFATIATMTVSKLAYA